MANIPQLANVKVLRSDILVDTSINSRQTTFGDDKTKINKLAESMKVQGVLHPPVLIRTSQAGKNYEGVSEQYLLVAGFRRHEAMGILEQLEGDYRLAPAAWTLKEALAANMIENLQREDLTAYDMAMQCARIAADFRLSGAEVAKLIRSYDSDPEGKQPLSEGHVNNLIRIVRKVHPTILKAWQDGHPAASIRNLIKIAGPDNQEEQLSLWLDLTEPKRKGSGEGDGDGTGAGDGTGIPSPTKRNRPTGAQIAIMLESIKESDKDDEWKKGATAALKWAGGMNEKIPGVKWNAAERNNKRKGTDAALAD